MTGSDLATSDWSELVTRLGRVVDLEESARVSGALSRRRRVASAGDLLRLGFAFVLGRLSLRMLSAWAGQCGLASLSDVALLKRLKGSADWVGGLVSTLLQERYPEACVQTGALRRLAVDATMVAPPGDKRTYWLVHTAFDIDRLRFCHVEVTDRTVAERLDLGGVGAGELRIGDRAHANAGALAAVLAGGGDFLVRAASTYPRLTDAKGLRLDRLSLCRQASQSGLLDREVIVESAKTDKGTRNKLRVPARLLILPLPPGAAAIARKKARKNAAQWGYTSTEAGAEMAGYLMILTSLSGAKWPPDALLATYRLRWQVELAFKRLKSIVGLEDLRARDPDLARLWINIALLAALLVEDQSTDLLAEGPASPPRALPNP